MMIDEPSYMSVPTFRNYEDYHDAEQYAKGWNDAMDFIFPEAEREMESKKKNFYIVKKERKEQAKDKEYKAKVITRGNCMICGKELTEGLFICKECGNKANKESEDDNE